MANMKIGTRLRCSFALLTLLLLLSEPQRQAQERASIARAGDLTEKGLA
jgi:hypothetical protein